MATSSAKNEPQASSPGGRRGRWVEIGVTAMWAVNVALLVGAAAWILFDGRFSHAASLLGAGTIFGWRADELNVALDVSQWRAWALRAISYGALFSFAYLFIGLIFGPARHRRVKSWLALMALVAVWLALLTSWPDLAWQGKQLRLARQIAAFEPAAASLRDDWPMDDDERENVGVFMAYPQPNPTMLLLLAPKEGAAERLFSAVERSPRGALRFELMGAESGDWLEWHPPGSEPQSFIGGLMGDYQLVRAAPLGEGWFAAHYRNAGPSEAP